MTNLFRYSYLMKPINTLLAILFISLLSSPSWSATLRYLVEREGLHYERFTDVPFNGKVTGNEQGSFKNGKKEGAWFGYWDNGQLRHQSKYSGGKLEGVFISYYGNGQLRRKGNLRSGNLEGAYISYHQNGQLRRKGNFRSGKLEGAYVYHHKDGTVYKPWSGTFKNGEKISD
jgi:antitoxin component YwqK of YwqJK toxin-antitoxin module